jgi:hypothetical protein
MSLKNPVTRPGIDPGTVRLVAQRLNHYATPGPLMEKTCNNVATVEMQPLHQIYSYQNSGKSPTPVRKLSLAPITVEYKTGIQKATFSPSTPWKHTWRVAPLIHNLGPRWMWVVEVTLRPLYNPERTPVPGAGPDDLEKRKTFTVTGIRTPNRPERRLVSIKTTLSPHS